MGKLLLRVLVALLKLLLQLALFAATGKWVKLEAQAPKPGRKQNPTKPKWEKRVKRPSRQPLPPLLGDEELRGGEAVWIGGEQDVRDRMPRAPRRKRVRMTAPPSAGHDARSLRAALADPRAVRDAIVLGAALGRRPGRR